MNPFQPQEPSNSFYESVQVGKYGHFPHDVTIFYTLYSTGSGEFSANGGQILDEQRDRGNRKLIVYTTNGNMFEITRKRRGGYILNTEGYWMNDRGRTYF